MSIKQQRDTEVAIHRFSEILKKCFNTISNMSYITDIPISTCSDLWNGKHFPGLDNLIKIKNACSCFSLDYILTVDYKSKDSDTSK